MRTNNTNSFAVPAESYFACSELATVAEKELSAFLHAVSELFGPEQALLASEDWLEELELLDWPVEHPPGSALLPWRQLSIKAATRLANRVGLLRIVTPLPVEVHDVLRQF